MDDNNLNEMIKKAQEMINNNQIPPELQSLVNNFNSGNGQNHNSNSQNNNPNNQGYSNHHSNNFGNQNYNNQSNNSSGQGYNNQSNNSNSQNSMPNIDMETLMKMQRIMSQMQNNGDNDMSRLLSSLKPYLRDEKKGKVDEYMKLVKMGQMTKILENLRW